MEKKQPHLFSAKLLKLAFFTVVVVSFRGLSHGHPLDQAGALKALWKAKRRNNAVDNEWVAPSLCADRHRTSAGGGKKEDDLIAGGLPGQPASFASSNKFKQYAGYVSVDEVNGRSLFYYFAEAVHLPSSKPLVLWLNGGPGCSSLGAGAMLELGPFGVNSNGKTLYPRRHSWNKVANMLFLESPAGVGFSYSNTTSDYQKSGDKRTAEDAYTFLTNWFKRYPEYKSRDFYITGESYAGYYIPELADTIVKRNKEADPSLLIRLKGIMIGNGIMNRETDDRGFFDYLWTHALISDETHQRLLEYCMNSQIKKCDYLLDGASKEIGGIDHYNIYAPLCLNASLSSRNPRGSGGYDPCETDYVHSYLNLPQVQKALHAYRTNLPYPWQLCSAIIVWNDSPSTMFPIYRRLIASGLQILLYSGDVDAVVPVSSTRYSIDALNLTVVKPWSPWTDAGGEVGGYLVAYNGLNFATVRGAGHQVPMFQPSRALSLFKMFLAAH
ncbi:serine carboxypeptidase II-2-like [Diospyros lotus]|uniref:serine carboxypeptidase II-2-like n=1 Tax=Diospyros lotus TaxID=55363 RepID=UPI00224FDC72|nr:serine carboxypeptidase II-2-like [Diospyros lotus]